MITNQPQAKAFYAQTTLNSIFSCSLVHAKQRKLTRFNYVKRIIAKQENCMGCGLCEVYCTVATFKIKRHSQSLQQRTAQTHKQSHDVQRNKPVSFAIQCRHCDDAPCVTACLSGAMQKDEKTGEVTHNKEKCMGCWTCIMVCPYGAIKMDKEGHVVAKCDLCQGFD